MNRDTSEQRSSDTNRFELIDSAFRRACERLKRADLLKEGTFATTTQFLQRETRCEGSIRTMRTKRPRE